MSGPWVLCTGYFLVTVDSFTAMLSDRAGARRHSVAVVPERADGLDGALETVKASVCQ
jgi:hypothetical protein